MSGTDDPPDDPDYERFMAQFQRHHDHLYEAVSDYMDSEDFDEEYAAHLLLDLAIKMRMTAYGIAVANPSIAGLKLELDRFRRDMDESLRAAKKGAEDFIGHIKSARAEAEADTDEDADKDNE